MRIAIYFSFLLLALSSFFVSNVVLNFLIFTLIIALGAQGWNILGGYAGQFSFGHAVFFGLGAYVMALGQIKFGLNAYLCLVFALFFGGILGLFIGFCSFRSGLKGSYFALVTLAFAEIFRIIFNASPFTGGAAGALIKLDINPFNMQFANRTSFFLIILSCVIAVYYACERLEKSRFGLYAFALRENENAALALSINVTAHKEKVITFSGMITSLAGAFYAQYFLYIDSQLVFGTWISVDLLLASLLGGIGTAFGPIIGAFVLHALSEITKLMVGKVIGLDLIIYGLLLILVVSTARKGIMGAINAKS